MELVTAEPASPQILTLREMQRAHLRRAMELFGPHRKAEAAAALGISEKTLYNKLHRYGLTEYIRGTVKAYELGRAS